MDRLRWRWHDEVALFSGLQPPRRTPRDPLRRGRRRGSSIAEKSDAMPKLGSTASAAATVTGRAALEGAAVHVVDILADPEYDMPETHGLGKSRTVLSGRCCARRCRSA